MAQSKLQKVSVPGQGDDSDELFGNAANLRHMLGFIGRGEHLYVAGTCGGWRKAYRQELRKIMFKYTSGSYVSIAEFSTSTSYRAAFGSNSRLKLAAAQRFPWSRNSKIQRAAGRFGTIETIEAALGYGMVLNDHVLLGAVEGGNLALVQWLMQVKGLVPKTHAINRAAAAGRMNVVRWLVEKNVLTDHCTFVFLASKNEIDMIKQLRGSGS